MSNNTQGKAFILSHSEVIKYMPNLENRISSPDSDERRLRFIWWLRSPGDNISHAGSISENGGFCSSIASFVNGVRPALWIKEPSHSVGDDLLCDDIEFKVLAREGSNALIISKHILFYCQYVAGISWNEHYIPYDEQGEGDIKGDLNNWFASLPEGGYLRTHATIPLTLTSEEEWGEMDEKAITKPAIIDSFDNLQMEFVLSAEDVQLVLDNLADRGYGYLKEKFESLPYEQQRQIINDSLFDVEDYLNDAWFNVLNMALSQNIEEVIEEQRKHEAVSLETESHESQQVSQKLNDIIQPGMSMFSQKLI